MKSPEISIRILVVEDFHAETDSIVRELNDAEIVYELRVEQTEVGVIMALSEYQPDIVLTPYSLTDTNAVKLLNSAQELGISAPFILMAFDLSEDIAIDMLAAGMEDYILRSTIKRLPIAIQKALQRRKTQIELERSSKSLKLAQHIAQIGSWELNPKDLTVWWSEEMYRIHGIEPQPIAVEFIRNITHPEDVNLFDNGFERIMNGEQTDFVYRLNIPETGQVKHVRGIGQLIKDGSGNIMRIFGTVQDVTAQVEAAERIETLSLVAKETINGVLIQDADGRIVWANRGFTDITGYSLGEAEGKEPWSFLAGEETMMNLVEETYAQIRNGHSFSSENVLTKKDGSKVWVATSFTPILDDLRNVVKIVSIGTDISKQKELQRLQETMLSDLEKMVEQRTKELELINQELRDEMWEKQRISDELYHSNLDLRDSIEYAKRIQQSILPTRESMLRSFNEFFILLLPKDVVSGDFYWQHRQNDLTYFAAIDCTGHGVPGALMSMIANELLNQVILQRKLKDPAQILLMLNGLMVHTLRQKVHSESIRDGMDIGLIVIDHGNNTLSYSGAFNTLYVISDGKLTDVSGSRFSIGGHLGNVKKSFETTVLNLKKGDRIYLSSDGYVDQFGGPDGKKFMKKRFEKLLLESSDSSMTEQREQLHESLRNWQGDLPQIDDVLVAGLRY